MEQQDLWYSLTTTPILRALHLPVTSMVLPTVGAPTTIAAQIGRWWRLRERCFCLRRAVAQARLFRILILFASIGHPMNMTVQGRAYWASLMLISSLLTPTALRAQQVVPYVLSGITIDDWCSLCGTCHKSKGNGGVGAGMQSLSLPCFLSLVQWVVGYGGK